MKVILSIPDEENQNIGRPNLYKSLEAIKPKGLNMIAKIG
jgi:hypothetical protein